jgi:hypothetical protein
MARLAARALAPETFYLGSGTLKNQNCLACREHAPRFLCYIFIYPRFPEGGLCSPEGRLRSAGSVRANPELISRTSPRFRPTTIKSWTAKPAKIAKCAKRVGSAFAPFAPFALFVVQTLYRVDKFSPRPQGICKNSGVKYIIKLLRVAGLLICRPPKKAISTAWRPILS